MIVTFLGTGTSQGVPIICCECAVCKSNNPKDNRLRSSILIESETTKVIIDAGPDFRQQLLRKNLKNERYDKSNSPEVAKYIEINQRTLARNESLKVFSEYLLIAGLSLSYLSLNSLKNTFKPRSLIFSFKFTSFVNSFFSSTLYKCGLISNA
jgi:phosphoribosyl 1,2-cyclic phosphate phosphodiesterase